MAGGNQIPDLNPLVDRGLRAVLRDVDVCSRAAAGKRRQKDLATRVVDVVRHDPARVVRQRVKRVACGDSACGVNVGANRPDDAVPEDCQVGDVLTGPSAAGEDLVANCVAHNFVSNLESAVHKKSTRAPSAANQILLTTCSQSVNTA